MAETKNLSGSIRREGNLIIGEGAAGMQVYDDTMNLALTKTSKTATFVKTAIYTAFAGTATYFACKFHNPYIGIAAGALSTIAVQQGKQAVDACKRYSHTLEEAVSHGWETKENLKRINWRYL
ncbi:MAG: hypothetical protein WCI72_00985 [archaeon]